MVSLRNARSFCAGQTAPQDQIGFSALAEFFVGQNRVASKQAHRLAAQRWLVEGA
jgi:hypothetical protein